MQKQEWRKVIRKGFEPPKISRDMPLPEMVKTIVEAVAEHLKKSGPVKAYLDVVSKGKGTDCPDSPVEEIQRYISTRYGKIDKSDPYLNIRFMETFMMPVAEFEREEVYYGLTEIDDRSDDESVQIVHGMEAARAFDRFWAAWFREVAAPFQALSEKHKETEKKKLHNILSEYDYTTLLDDHRLPWALVFPDEIDKANDWLNALTEELSEDTGSVKRFLRAWVTANACRNIEELETHWAEVDRAWIKIPADCRVFPVHGMESAYEHPFAVSPEFRIMVRTDIGQEMIASFREATPVYAGKLGADPDIIRNKLQYMDIGVFYTAVWGGTCLNFRMSGQVVPNRQEILAQGGKIFMDIDSVGQSIDLYHEALDQHCPAETAGLLKPLVTVDGQLAGVAGHECFHPVGRTGESDAALGDDLHLLEEAKASMGGYLVAEYRDPNPDKRLAIIAPVVARIFRFFHKAILENETASNYVRESMVACTTLHRAGVIKMTDKGLTVDVGKAGSRAWFDEIEGFIRQIVSAYADKNGDRVRDMMKVYCNKNEGIIADVIRWVNR